MSSSVFKEYPSSHATDGEPKLESNLVVFINKNGSVTVDQAALQDFLVQDTDTSVSVIRVGSPTPSLQKELDEQEELEKEMSKDYEEDHDDPDREETVCNEDDTGDKKEVDKVPHVSVTIENFFNPIEAKQLATDILNIAGITNPLHITHDYELERYVIANDHCYTPLTSPSQRKAKPIQSASPTGITPGMAHQRQNKLQGSEGQTGVAVNTPNRSARPKVARVMTKQAQAPITSATTEISDDEESDKMSDDFAEENSESESTYYSPSESENDRDSDLDFNVNDRPSRMRKVNRNRKVGAVKLLKATTGTKGVSNRSSGGVTRKRQSASTDGSGFLEDDSQSPATQVPGQLINVTSPTAISNKKNTTKMVKKIIHNRPVSQQPLLTKAKQVISVSTVAGLVPTTSTISTKPPSRVFTMITTKDGAQQRVILTKLPNSKPKSMDGCAQLSTPVDISIHSPVQSTSGPPVPALAPISDVMAATTATITKTIGTPIVLKKDKKPPAHVEALFSDMTSLFSTPDIIKKVGSDNRPSIISVVTIPAPPPKPIQIPQPTSQISTTINSIMPMKIPVVGAPGTNKCFFIGPATNQKVNLGSEQDKQLDLIDSFVQQELKQPATPVPTEPMNVAIPNIVKMLEKTPSEDLPSISSINPTELILPSPVTQSLSTVVHTQASPSTMTFVSPSNTNATMLVDNDILDGLTHPEDGLTDDLMQHVAKLVEDKNLQEVIDKQVLGVTNTTTPKASGQFQANKPRVVKQTRATMPAASVTPIAHTIIPPTPIAHTTIPTTPITPTPITPTPTEIPPTAAQTSPRTPAAATKEPIKIVRSDGRVITLPPIEAPTTRGAKRRAQNQPSTTTTLPTPEPQKQIITPVTKIMKVDTPTPIVKEKTPAKDRRQSVSVRKLNAEQKAKATLLSLPVPPASVAASKSTDTKSTDDYNAYDDDDEDGSDGSYNSEDDPYRLWCICRQPHNNRFMICCDKCEDWFHGKCVNVTKAMGAEMEQRGAEWMCPNCVKKMGPQQQTIPQMTKKFLEQKAQANTSNPPLSTPASIPHTLTQSDALLLSCFVCKKPARPNSIYCSDDCIRKHAQTTTNLVASNASSTISISSPSNTSTGMVSATTSASIITPAETKSSLSTVKSPQDKSRKLLAIDTLPHSLQKTTGSNAPSILNKPQPGKKPSTVTREVIPVNRNNRVDVYEPKTGRCLIGNSAPTIENLQQWLQQHPTFQVIKPNSPQAIAVKAKKMRMSKQLSIHDDATKLFSVEGNQQLPKSQAPLKEGQRPSQNPTTQRAPPIQTTLKVAASKRVVLVKEPNSQQQQEQQQQPTTQSLQQQQSRQVVKAVKPQVQTTLKLQATTKTGTSATVKQTPTTTNQSPISKQSPTNKQSPTPKQNQSQLKSKNKQSEQRSSDNTKPAAPKKNQAEPIRINVQRTLKEQLALRMAEVTDATAPKLTNEEIEKFALDTEREIYYLFGKDTGNKYRAKYRTLVHNIKDRKNETLFRKICDKSCAPKQLVRMSSDELASQELAMWRENENKHQLEIIKKAELDLLASAKSYVLKTHKGEEVIENKASDRVTLDPSISVEDVVTVLNNSQVSSTSEHIEEVTSPVVKDTRIDSRFGKYLSMEGNSGVIGTLKQSTPSVSGTSSSGTTPKKKSGKRSRSRSRSKERQSDSKKSSSSKHKRKRSRDRRSSRSPDRDKFNKDKQNKNDRRDREKSTSKSSSSVKRDVLVESKKPALLINEPPKPTKKEENFSLIDKILEAQSTIDRILRPDETARKEEVEKKVDALVTAAVALASGDQSTVQKSINSESEEPSSTVTIPTPPPEALNQQKDSPEGSMKCSAGKSAGVVDDGTMDNFPILWSGNIIMIDVVSFEITIEPLADDCLTIKSELPKGLEVVGRIQPDTVLDYIKKIKENFNKEIILIRFGSAVGEDKEAYYTLFKYLSSRKRFGVIKTKSAVIKDFYIFPLAAHKSLPSILMTGDKPIFENSRPDLLLGIIVKNILSMPARRFNRGASVSAKALQVTGKVAKTKLTAVMDEERYTPPTSPKTVVLPAGVNSLPSTKEIATVLEDGDEPYSPGGSDDDSPPLKYTTPSIIPPLTTTSAGSLTESDMHRKMVELTWQIEKQKEEIAGMLQTEVIQLDEPYSPTSMLGNSSSAISNSPIVGISESVTIKPIPALSDISIPSNLQEILNSINKLPVTTSTVSSVAAATSATTLPSHLHQQYLTPTIALSQNSDGEEEYTPTAIGGASSLNATAGIPKYKPMDYIPSKTLQVQPPPLSRNDVTNTAPSKLAQLTDEELLSMVPDDIELNSIPLPKRKSEHTASSTSKKMKSDLVEEPPPPGLEDEYNP